MKPIRFIGLLCFFACLAEAIFDIKQFGAIPSQDHLSAQWANQKAIMLAIEQANSTQTQ